jgi:NAD(P)-dependent dehydrogenase (short-subunit alcohol dehydrogenase family)
MAGPVILITGGSRGIGAATARLAAARGYDVCFSYLSQQVDAETLRQELNTLGANALAVAADVGKEADILNLFARCDAYFGRLDALVNNAAILRKNLVQDTDLTQLERLFAVNVYGTILCSREALKRMSIARGGRGGAMVNVSSIAARFGSPFEYVDYAATKAAVDTFTVGFAKEIVAEGVRVNAVRPGIINTEIHAKGGEPGRIARIAPTIPMARAGEPEEIAKTILWLLSEEASYMTGALVDVSGGR